MGLPTSLPGPIEQPESPLSPIHTAKPQIGFATRLVQPPSIVYVTQDDSLSVVVFNSAPNMAIAVGYRLLRADGVIIAAENAFQVAAQPGVQVFTVNLSEGFLLSAVCATQQVNVRRGQCFVSLSIVPDGPGHLVAQGYLSTDYLTYGGVVAWPGGRQISSIEGPGHVYVTTFANPPAGSGYLIQPPTNRRWRVISLAVHFVTSGVVINRFPTFLWGAGGSGAGKTITSTPVTAGSGVNVWLANYGYQQPDNPGFDIFLGIGEYLFLDANVGAELTADGLQALDAFFNLSMLVEEWMEPTS